MLKKIILAAAVSAAPLFAQEQTAGTAGVPSIKQPAGAKQQCADCVLGHYALTTVW
jgi:hypothetical protein